MASIGESSVLKTANCTPLSRDDPTPNKKRRVHDAGISNEDEDDLLASDDDNNDNEEEEDHALSDVDMEQDSGAGTPVDLSLRNYQNELATPAVKGQNTIIYAPTGSGKTRVALHIVKKHLEDRDGGKVVFMARTVPLVSQQFKIFEKCLPDYKCVMVHGESGNHQDLHLMLDDFDILVMTPMILDNHLREKTIPSLSAFSLIIFDECHHTRKGEPYNSVMKHYLRSRDKGEQRLPQIVGLTASIGVDKASTLDQAKDKILEIVANLDASTISRVRDHQEELENVVPRPDEVLESLTPRRKDKVWLSITRTMKQLETLLTQQVSQNKDIEFSNIASTVEKRPTDRNSQKYGQWAVQLCDMAQRIYIPQQTDEDHPQCLLNSRREISQSIKLLCEALIAYNEALDVHELTRPEDVLDHLKKKLGPQHGTPSPIEIKMTGLFTDLQHMLSSVSNTPNPNLTKLSHIITDRLGEKSGEESRVMVFVQTRATCLALCDWLNKGDVPPLLTQLHASPFTGSAAQQEHGGMTQNGQEEFIQKFRQGDIKLLVCTTVGQEGMDIPDCNLVIRYNHVGNEVATVQTRGRSRKAGGLSVLLAMPRVIQKEVGNKKRVEIMNRAVQEFSEDMHSDSTKKRIRKTQQQVMDKEEMKKLIQLRTKNAKKKEGTLFSLECNRCRKVRVSGFRIRTINKNHHVIIGNDLVDEKKVSIKEREKPKAVNNLQFTGDIVCTKCPDSKPNVLGTVSKYQGVDFLTLKAVSWVVLNDKDSVVKSGKWKWSDLGYSIAELNTQDMRVHLGDEDMMESD